jgi:hypothetical protein
MQADERPAAQQAAHPIILEAQARGLDPVYVYSRMFHTTFLSRRHGYVYVSIPKAACTELKLLIAEVEGGKLNTAEKPYLRETRVPMLIHQRRLLDVPTVLDMNAGEIGELVSGQSNFFVFALVRNPFSRLVSTYENKVRMHEPGFQQAGQLWGASRAGDDVRAAFARFVREGVPYFKSRIGDHHFVDQRRLLIPELIPYSRIFRVEQFGEFENVFFSLLRSKGYAGPLGFSGQNRTRYPNWRHYYDEETARRVAEMYKNDFDALGYDVNSWRSEGEIPELRTTPDEAYWRRAVIERNEMIDYLHNHLQPRS